MKKLRADPLRPTCRRSDHCAGRHSRKDKGKAEVLYTKGCDLVDAHWPESEIIDYPLTDDEQAEIDKAVENARQS